MFWLNDWLFTRFIHDKPDSIASPAPAAAAICLYIPDFEIYTFNTRAAIIKNKLKMVHAFIKVFIKGRNKFWPGQIPHPSTTCSAWEMVSPEFLEAEIWHTGVKFPQEFRNDHTFLRKCTMSTGITVIMSTMVKEWSNSKGVIMGFKMLLSRWRSRINMLERCLAPLVVHWSTKKWKISDIKVNQK